MAPWALSPLSGFVHCQNAVGFKRDAWKMRTMKLASTFANDSLY